MKSIKRKIRKKIKKMFKEHNKINFYKEIKTFKNVSFLPTKIYIIFSNKIDFDKLFWIESLLIENNYSEEKWMEIILKIKNDFKNEFINCDWESFGIFCYYVIEHWKFNLKKESIYSLNNFNEINQEKSFFYNKWLNSFIEINNKDFNIYVRKVLKSI